MSAAVELATLASLLETDAVLSQTFVTILASLNATLVGLSRAAPSAATGLRLSTALVRRCEALASLRAVHARMAQCRARAAVLLGARPPMPTLAALRRAAV
jgi:hypothetical protein